MKESSIESKAEVSFKDNYNHEIVYKKILNLKTTISDILEIQSKMKDMSNFEIYIRFSGINLLDQIWLTQSEENVININYHFSINELSKIVHNKEGIRDRLIKTFYSEIWLKDKRILDILDSDELFLEWGGSKDNHTPVNVSDLTLNYYVDSNNAWLLFLRRLNKTDEYETITLESIRNNALKLSVITQEIMNSITLI